nr:MAG TPA: hypothetical protein [Caudoviricetes sp.]DAY48061.1 MAG TPA: hypothetical protein [Caudoviricetes sp.]
MRYLNKKPAGNLAGNIFINNYVDYVKRTLYNDKRLKYLRWCYYDD